MKSCFIFLFACLLLCTVVFAQAAPEGKSIQYITQYQLASDRSPVHGLFDLGNKPSVKIIYPSLQGGKIRFQLHGRHYLSPVGRGFSVSASFEDVTGRVFQQSDKISFKSADLNPQWFTALENLVGLYGNQSVEIKVPPGTSVINLLGDDEASAVSPNELLGYISHLQIPTQP